MILLLYKAKKGKKKRFTNLLPPNTADTQATSRDLQTQELEMRDCGHS
jgi:hypothetical protein